MNPSSPIETLTINMNDMGGDGPAAMLHDSTGGRRDIWTTGGRLLP